jgi:hypothetical protein
MTAFGYNVSTITGKWLKGTLVCLVIVFLCVVQAIARRSAREPVELTLYPAKIAESPQEYALLPDAGKLTDADAVPLYEKAIRVMPKDINQMQIQDWLKLPIEQFPQKKAEEVVQKCVESLRLIARAARCKECKWPEPTPGKLPDNLAEYRRFAFILELWARLEISRGQYKGALGAIQTGFAMARHIGQGPASIQAMVAGAIGGLMYKEVEQFIQQKDSPNLYWALANLPRPLVDMDRALEKELANLKNHLEKELANLKNHDVSVRKEAEKQMKEALDKMRMMEKKGDTRLNALQCLEAIRDYAATHDGQLPEQLSDISDVDVPQDVLADKAFEYRRTAEGAVLQSAVPEGGEARDALRYEIVLKK